jgi:3-oxoacyl-[acyl-carrier protein] reductase
MLEQKSGSIVGISSLAAWRAPERAHYAAAKTGIVGFVRAVGVEVAAQGIRINAVSPGPIATNGCAPTPAILLITL